MNDAVWTVLIAGFLPIVCAGIAKWGAKGYDNHNPRAWLAQQHGKRVRADAAQANSFEAFPFFAAGMILAVLAEVDEDTLAVTGWFFIAMRVLYIYCYVNDLATLRSFAWLFGYAAVVRLFLLAL